MTNVEKLQIALQSNLVADVEALLESHPNILSDRDHNGYVALNFWLLHLECTSPEVLALLAAKTPVSCMRSGVDSKGSLQLAVWRGSGEAFREILKRLCPSENEDRDTLISMIEEVVTQIGDEHDFEDWAPFLAALLGSTWLSTRDYLRILPLLDLRCFRNASAYCRAREMSLAFGNVVDIVFRDLQTAPENSGVCKEAFDLVLELLPMNGNHPLGWPVKIIDPFIQRVWYKVITAVDDPYFMTQLLFKVLQSGENCAAAEALFQELQQLKFSKHALPEPFMVFMETRLGVPYAEPSSHEGVLRHLLCSGKLRPELFQMYLHKFGTDCLKAIAFHRKKQNLLHRVCHGGDIAIAVIFFSLAPPEAFMMRDYMGLGPLHVLIYSGHFLVLPFISQLPREVLTFQDSMGRSPKELFKYLVPNAPPQTFALFPEFAKSAVVS